VRERGDPIALFGGTFDPVHFGHLRAALEARRKLGLASLRLLPAGNPPHRRGTYAPATDRLAMLRLAAASAEGFEVDDREIRRGGYSYMVDTLKEISSEAPGRPLLLLIGQDAANGLDGWHQWRRLFELAHLVILRRPGAAPQGSRDVLQALDERRVDDPEALRASVAGSVFDLEVTPLEISSTGIRAECAAGYSPRYLLPDPVLDYIEEHGLYRAEGG
jgi:nicotinate-nucleotide adenylyltransferase